MLVPAFVVHGVLALVIILLILLIIVLGVISFFRLTARGAKRVVEKAEGVAGNGRARHR